MTTVVRSPGRLSRKFILLLRLLHFASLLSIPIHGTMANYNVNEIAKLRTERSMTWYRKLHEHPMSNPDRVDEKKVEKELADDEMITNSRDVDAEKHVDVDDILKLEEQEVVVHEDGKMERAVTEEQDSNKDPRPKTTEEQEQGEQQKASDDPEETKEEPFVFPEPHILGPTIKDWDEQRARWIDANPHMKTTPGGKPRVLIVTGSQPKPCRTPAGDNFHIKSFKLKIDYARMHNYEIYYSLAWLDSSMGGVWVKLPVVRNLMLTHPEIEWFLWMDSDAVFTDMLFEAPFHTYEGYNMIMWGWEDGLYKEKSWTAFNAGVFILRNCQWSLDLMDKWSPMGPDGQVRNEYGKMFSTFLTGRNDDPADDQSALAYLILTDEAVKSKIKLVDSYVYMISGWWIPVVGTYETCMEKYHPGLGDKRWPWITHFTGCSPCGGDNNLEYSTYNDCLGNFTRAYNFADNQVLAYMGYQHESLSSPNVIRTRNETDRPLEFVGVNPWEKRVAQVAAAAGTSP